MNILDVEDMIKGRPGQQEAEAPTGQVPQFLVISEIQRRTDMRKRFADQQQAPQGTVKDQVVQQGIAAIAPPDPQMQAARALLCRWLLVEAYHSLKMIQTCSTCSG